ncbi:nucleotidyltransferase [Xylanibacillus composti]|uniref:Nucleotidyltransferase n=1 Tax=Xylanibacillus composti TaxID=1572762 RepID=A0A8J4H837_9BACL|nr:nucleotidyltransferase family protein [Xylanibacillus composti]GIQ70749.1 nucleotidyltransferase [Xylanibacillus composti]
MSTLELINRRKSEILTIAAENGISNVRLFGSVVRGTDDSESDIDLLVELGEERTLFDLIRFKQAVEDMLGRKVDVVSDQAVHHALKQNILSEAIQL